MSNIRPFHDDILVKFRTSVDKNLTEGGIYIKEDTTHTEYEYYDVVAIGPDVKDVKPGDTIMMSWARMSPPFNHEGNKLAITSVKEVWGVLEETDAGV